MQPPRVLIDLDDVRPAFAVEYARGTPCDLTGRLRRVRVNYVCNSDPDLSPAGFILRITETATCEYELLASVPALCLHPNFKCATRSLSYSL